MSSSPLSQHWPIPGGILLASMLSVVVTSGPTNAAEVSPSDHAVLLDTGVVVVGDVERHGGSILVRRDSDSTLRLPQHRVLLTASDEDELWRRFEAIHPGHRWSLRRSQKQWREGERPVHPPSHPTETNAKPSGGSNRDDIESPEVRAMALGATGDRPKDVRTFAKHVQPLLIGHCGKCHGTIENASSTTDGFALKFDQWRRASESDTRWNHDMAQRSIRSKSDPRRWMDYFFGVHGGMHRPVLDPRHRLASERIWRFVQTVGGANDREATNIAASTVEVPADADQKSTDSSMDGPSDLKLESSPIMQVGYVESAPVSKPLATNGTLTDRSGEHNTTVKRLPQVKRPTDPSIFNRMPR